MYNKIVFVVLFITLLAGCNCGEKYEYVCDESQLQKVHEAHMSCLTSGTHPQSCDDMKKVYCDKRKVRK